MQSFLVNLFPMQNAFLAELLLKLFSNFFCKINVTQYTYRFLELHFLFSIQRRSISRNVIEARSKKFV